MSGVANPNTVDLVTHDPETDEYALIMVETRAWDGSEERLQQISKKVENYLSFALYGQMTKLYPEALGKRIRLQLDCESPPDPKTARFLEEARKRLEEGGFRFVVNVSE
jgi:hypothetical protein